MMNLRRRLLSNLMGGDDMRVLGTGIMSSTGTYNFNPPSSGKSWLMIINLGFASDSEIAVSFAYNSIYITPDTGTDINYRTSTGVYGNTYFAAKLNNTSINVTNLGLYLTYCFPTYIVYEVEY